MAALEGLAAHNYRQAVLWTSWLLDQDGQAMIVGLTEFIEEYEDFGETSIHDDPDAFADVLGDYLCCFVEDNNLGDVAYQRAVMLADCWIGTYRKTNG